MRLREINEQDSKLNKVKKFARWAMDELGIEKEPNIKYGNDMDHVLDNRTFGSTRSNGDIWVHLGNRNSADIMRTLCHELVHHRQFEIGQADDNMDEDQRQEIEDIANAIAGRMMRIYGKHHGEIYESWTMTKSVLSESDFHVAYMKRQKRQMKEDSSVPFRPDPMRYGPLRRLAEDKMWESTNSDIGDLKEYQSELIKLDQRRNVRMAVGSKTAVLQFIPHMYGSANTIEVQGFKTPKQIEHIEFKADGVVDWIEFSDGSSYPDKEFLDRGQGGGETDGIVTLFYPTRSAADRALIVAVLKKPDSWEVSTANLKESKAEISEGRTGSLQPDVAAALPATYVIPELPNQDPYLQYRFGVAIASAKGKKQREKDGVPPFDEKSAWGENEIVVSYDPDIGEYIDDALKDMGLKGKKMISTKKSEEVKTVGKKSPVQGFKGFK